MTVHSIWRCVGEAIVKHALRKGDWNKRVVSAIRTSAAGKEALIRGVPTADRDVLLNGLVEAIGSYSRPCLEQLPTAELRYLASRGDLHQRYADPRRGQGWLMWEMSAVERGRLALADVEACAQVEWKNDRALDVGCGDGGFLVAMAQKGAAAYGLDLMEFNVLGAMLRAEAWGLPFNLARGSAMSLPYRSQSFDAVTCGDVIEHVANQREALREIKRVLRPGGILWLAAPTRYFWPNLLRDPHYGYFGLSALGRRLAASYLTRVRKELPKPTDYAVERLPAYGSTVAALRAMEFEILAGEYRQLWALRNPDCVVTPWKKRTLNALLSVGFRVPLTMVFRVGAELFWPIRLVCRKAVGI